MDNSVLERLQAARAEATSNAGLLKAQLDQAEKWRKLLESVTDTLVDQPAQTAATLSRAQELVKRQEASQPETVEALRALWTDCKERARSAAADSVRTFADTAEAAGLVIDASSRHPRYSFDDHTISVELQERDLSATIEIRHGDRIRMPLDVAPVVARIATERDRLFARPWKAEAFLKQLRQAYKKHKNTGDGVPLRDLATDLAGKGKKPRLDEFSVDLGRLLRDPALDKSGVRIATNQTRDTDRGLLLYGLEHGGYVMSVSIEVPS